MSQEVQPALVLVVGVGRSGTSLLTGILGGLGFHVPQPEVSADATNPRGFSEPRWVVDFHTRMLRRHRVTVNDSRPQAWDITFAATEDLTARVALREWLAAELRAGHPIVVKDPRTVWFLPLWVLAAGDLGVETTFVTMLRHPAEVLKSAVTSYGTWQSEASRAAAWLNVALETELVTRGHRRAVVRYDDLLADWRREIARIGELLALPLTHRRHNGGARRSGRRLRGRRPPPQSRELGGTGRPRARRGGGGARVGGTATAHRTKRRRA